MRRTPLIQQKLFDSAANAPEAAQLEIASLLSAWAQPLSVLPGEYLFREDDNTDGLYILRQGRIAISMRSPRNGILQVGECGAGTLIDLGSAMSGGIREYTAQALTQAALSFVPREALLERIRSNVVFAIRVMHLIAAETSRTTDLALRLRQKRTIAANCSAGAEAQNY